MGGEKLGWYIIAHELHMTVDEAKHRISSTGYVEWLTYLDWKANAFHREDYYLAQIACEIRRVLSKSPSSINIKDFILKFAAPKKKTEEQILEEKAQHAEAQKAIWLSMFGLSDGAVTIDAAAAEEESRASKRRRAMQLIKGS